MKIIVFLLCCMFATPAFAAIDVLKMDLTGMVAAGIAARATAYEGGSAVEVLRAYATTKSPYISMVDSIIRIWKANKNNVKVESVDISIWKYRVDMLYKGLLDNIKDNKKRKELIAEQEKWNKTGLDQDARLIMDIATHTSKTEAYSSALEKRYNTLDKLRKSLGLPQSIALQLKPKPVLFDDLPKEDVCGDVITNFPINEDGNVIVANLDGNFTAFYTENYQCRKAMRYMCGKLGKSEDTPSEIRKVGITSKKIFNIKNCMGN